nr:MAG TPA: hypothetical protein [Caudoviricetes sp.]
MIMTSRFMAQTTSAQTMLQMTNHVSIEISWILILRTIQEDACLVKSPPNQPTKFDLLAFHCGLSPTNHFTSGIIPFFCIHLLFESGRGKSSRAKIVHPYRNSLSAMSRLFAKH